MARSLLVLGATSAIAKATAGCFAENGFDLLLAGRDNKELQRMAADFSIRYGVRVETAPFDALEYVAHEAFVDTAVSRMNGIDGALVAFGTLGEQSEAVKSFEASKSILEINFLGACSIMHHLANYFEDRGSGFLIGISSVAGDRGRQSNYVYGAAKGGMNLYMQGLRNRLHQSNIFVMTVEPGFVDTQMTFGKGGMFLVASPESVGESVYRAWLKRKDIVYVPWFWRYIMGMIKMIPESLFKRLKL